MRYVHPEEVPAPDGLDGMLISPRAAGAGLGALLARARSRVVLLSALTVAHPVGEPRFRAAFEAAEDLVTGSGAEWTILRGADYAANTLTRAGQLAATGTVRGAYPLARTSTVDERDVAAVAVLALTGSGHAGQRYPLTGEQSLSQPDKVAAIAAATGRDLTFTEVTPDEVRRGMRAAGLPDEIPRPAARLPRGLRPRARARHRHRPAAARPAGPHLRRVGARAPGRVRHADAVVHGAAGRRAVPVVRPVRQVVGAVADVPVPVPGVRGRPAVPVRQ